MNSNEAIKKMLASSEGTIYAIARENQLSSATLYNWCHNRIKANTTLIRLIIACSKNDEQLLENIKLFSDEKQEKNRENSEKL